ncbi:MAG: hypothetical protein WC699_14855 [Bacteroidales bacterium]|jgi:hypothetical protein
MQKINSEASLREAIVQLEIQQAYEGILLKDQFKLFYESIKPISLIKTVLKQAVESQGLKDNLVSTSVGLTAGFISKLLFQGLTKNPVKKLIGTALMFGITNVVAKHPETVRVLGHKFLQIFKKKKA